MKALALLAFAWLPVSGARAATECMLNFPKCSATADRIGPGGATYSGDDAWDFGWHRGFVMGVGLATIQKQWCPNDNFSEAQLSAIVSKFVKDNPKVWNDRPQGIVVRALAQAYPCK